MFDKLEDLLIRFEEIMGELNEPDVTANQERFRALMKEQSDLTPIVEAYREYKKCNQDIEDSLMMLDEENDPDMREMLKEELNSAKTRVSELEEELKILLLPKDPNDEKNVIVEIRAGAGGDEAALFAAEIYRMYVRYAERQRWRVETMDVEEIGIGGMKYVSFMISGQGAYSRLKYESGVHRVQRVPETESGGRIHTSTITVAIMPGYIVGKKECVENAAYRLTSPGLGKEVGASLGVIQSFYQGFFMAPTVVSGALKGAVFAANIYEKLGFSVIPNGTESRHDIIQAVTFNNPDAMIAFCEGIQAAAPVDSYVTPEPWAMPGYDSDVIMAAGAFVQGSSIELSADGPIKPPYAVYFQGGLTWYHAKLGILMSLQKLKERNLVNTDLLC